jgi:hypothetical protein
MRLRSRKNFGKSEVLWVPGCIFIFVKVTNNIKSHQFLNAGKGGRQPCSGAIKAFASTGFGASTSPEDI